MSDIMSILQSSYTANTQSLIAPGSKFANVDATQWQGKWTGTDDKKQSVSLSITKVSGYRANVSLSDATEGQANARAFITTKNTFRVGDSQFTLTGANKGVLTTIVTDPTTGNQSSLTVPLTRET
jgi:hypothetical protein